MPLSELVYKVFQPKSDSSQDDHPSSSNDPSFMPENDSVELVWENGQIQTSKSRKVQSFHTLTHQNLKIRDKMGKFGTAEPVLNEIPMPVPSVELGLNQDDDMVPWLNYHINESPQHDFCSEFLPELSGVTLHSSSSLDHRNVLEASLGDNTRPRRSTSQQYQPSIPDIRSRFSMDNGESARKTVHQTSIAEMLNPAAGSCFRSSKMQKHVSVSSATNSSIMNFSHFARPASLVKAGIRNIGAKEGVGTPGIDRIRNKITTNPAEVTLNGTAELGDEPSSDFHPRIVLSKFDANHTEIAVISNQEDGSRNDKNCSQNFVENINKRSTDGEKTTEPVVASSSVCSGNGVERASDDATPNLKRRNRDAESEEPSEDVEEESVGIKKTAPGRVGSGSKRSRATEVHNLSERRRRDRINEKMCALQELVPNCNKVDKASMLDEAIEYLKTLQLQVQIMSMGAGMYMPSMMLPPGMRHMAHMAQFSPMGLRMGIGFGMGMPDMNVGSSGSMQQMPRPSAFHGIGASNFPMFGLPGQGLPTGFPPQATLVSPGPLLKPNTMDNLDSAHVSGPKDSIQNINSHNTNNLNQNGQATKEYFEQRSSVQCSGQVTDDGGTHLTSESAENTARGSGMFKKKNLHMDS